MEIILDKFHKTFNGETLFFSHESKTTKTKMKFSCFIPNENRKVDNAIIWLSGLTCTEENFITKAGAQKFLAGSNTMIICPDTSPRGLDLPNEHENYDFGSGAGFYLNATTDGYKDHYQMYDYITKDILEILKSNFGVKNMSIMGHSMGGHGALMVGLRNPSLFKSLSAFSPITNPINCEWGKKAFSGYLGNNEDEWRNYDSCELVTSGNVINTKILIDQGLADEFYPDQLLSANFEDACKKANQALELRLQEGFDHSFYFISTFIKDHIDLHLGALEL